MALRAIRFTVDSALLTELGERLVGRAHVALAELIKNGYDADAKLVDVMVSDRQIEVVDNGHGMSRDAFEHFWMRIGSQHKDRRRVSPGGRPLTGSKGVGRLSAQFLAQKMSLETRARGQKALRAEVDWKQAVAAGELTSAEALWEDLVDRPPFADGATTGTRLVLTVLNQTWTRDALVLLARELWPLQPPYVGRKADGFRVQLSAPDVPGAQDQFDFQMRAILELWEARIVGRLRPDDAGGGRIDVELHFRDDTTESASQRIEGLRLDDVSFEIRVFDLRNRQPFGIKVDDARAYLNQFGGVHVYDAGFHLPYYGAEVDWLKVEFDHAHRLGRSQLLPDDLQVAGGLNFLPTNSRLYGWVEVDTGHERANARKHRWRQSDALAIQVSRDRLIDNAAYAQLQEGVRWALDFYAMSQARRTWHDAPRHGPHDFIALPQQVVRVEEVLERHRADMAEPAFDALSSELDRVLRAVELEGERVDRQAGLLGALATAGISAVAAEHEVGRQVAALQSIQRRLERIARRHHDPELHELAKELADWVQSTRQARALFQPVMDADSRELVESLAARPVLENTVEQCALLLRGIKVDLTSVPDELRLPPGRYAEWSSLFQNVLINAANAVAEVPLREVAVRARRVGRRTSLLVEDTGVGVDLADADALFEPFARRQFVSVERQALGAGGMGLGLTITRMIAGNLGCSVGFTTPSNGYNTAFEIAWEKSD